MTSTLSICIPTLNRPELLLQSLNSILRESSLLDQIEICISNNCSDADYAKVDKLLIEVENQCSIKYVRHAQRLPLDENHHYVKCMAESEYVYFLGDDDFFLSDELKKLLNFINQKKPDLAIFNGYLVDEKNTFLGMHFELASFEYKSLEAAFRDLRDKGTFGSVLVRKEHLQDDDFRCFYQTDHAYGCYWLSLFRKNEQCESLNISVPDFPCVAIRCASKTYNHIDVYFRTIPYEMSVRQQMIKTGPMQQLLVEHAVATEKFTASLRFLCYLSEAGHELRTIKVVNPAFYQRYEFRIWIARLLASSIFYKVLRFLFKMIIKRPTKASSEIKNTEIRYKLSSAYASE
jgi:glycosyltransferase involved in cell wall biosynthesis